MPDPLMNERMKTWISQAKCRVRDVNRLSHYRWIGKEYVYNSREFPGGLVVETWLFHCCSLGSIPGLEQVRTRKTDTIWYHLYVESKMWHKWTCLQKRNRLVVAGVGGSGMDWEVGVSRCKLFHLEWISNEVLLYCTGNYIQSPRIEHDGRY